jgi:hypothetical protein
MTLEEGFAAANSFPLAFLSAVMIDDCGIARMIK